MDPTSIDQFDPDDALDSAPVYADGGAESDVARLIADVHAAGRSGDAASFRRAYFTAVRARRA